MLVLHGVLTLFRCRQPASYFEMGHARRYPVSYVEVERETDAQMHRAIPRFAAILGSIILETGQFVVGVWSFFEIIIY